VTVPGFLREKSLVTGGARKILTLRGNNTETQRNILTRLTGVHSSRKDGKDAKKIIFDKINMIYRISIGVGRRKFLKPVKIA
jgi:hypothetical protein